VTTANDLEAAVSAWYDPWGLWGGLDLGRVGEALDVAVRHLSDPGSDWPPMSDVYGRLLRAMTGSVWAEWPARRGDVRDIVRSWLRISWGDMWYRAESTDTPYAVVTRDRDVPVRPLRLVEVHDVADPDGLLDYINTVTWPAIVARMNPSSRYFPQADDWVMTIDSVTLTQDSCVCPYTYRLYTWGEWTPPLPATRIDRRLDYPGGTWPPEEDYVRVLDARFRPEVEGRFLNYVEASRMRPCTAAQVMDVSDPWLVHDFGMGRFG